MAVIVPTNATGMNSLNPDAVLQALQGRLTLADVADAPNVARYAVSAVDGSNMPMLTGAIGQTGSSAQVGSAGVTSFNGISGSVIVPDVINSGNQLRVGLNVAGSGSQVGDQRNLLPVTVASFRSVLSASPISFTITSGSPNSTINFTTTAFSLYAGSATVNYSANSITHQQPNGTTFTYYLYMLDPTYAGGLSDLHVTDVPQTMSQQDGVVNIGNCDVTVSSGGGGSGGTGSGGGGWCVADDMFVGEGRRAGDAEIGDPFDCIDLPTAAGKHVRSLQGVSRGTEDCVRMITSDGCALVCSLSTPFDLVKGGQTTAPYMLGEQVITDLGTATVASLALVGPRPVTRAHLGGVSYAAGADPMRRIYSHNAGVSKP